MSRVESHRLSAKLAQMVALVPVTQTQRLLFGPQFALRAFLNDGIVQTFMPAGQVFGFFCFAETSAPGPASAAPSPRPTNPPSVARREVARETSRETRSKVGSSIVAVSLSTQCRCRAAFLADRGRYGRWSQTSCSLPGGLGKVLVPMVTVPTSAAT